MNPARLILLFVLLSIVPRMAHAADIIVMISGGFKSTYEALAPGFEKMTGSHLVLVPGPSEGSTKEAIPNRLARGEVADVLIMVGSALDKLVARGDALGRSEVELALSPIGMCVRADTSVPDISTVDKFVRFS
jgi:molybdate transport system substrate-binding protein